MPRYDSSVDERFELTSLLFLFGDGKVLTECAPPCSASTKYLQSSGNEWILTSLMHAMKRFMMTTATEGTVEREQAFQNETCRLTVAEEHPNAEEDCGDDDLEDSCLGGEDRVDDVRPVLRREDLRNKA